MKKLLFLFALSLCSLAAWAYDFSAVAPTGQTLYYTITSSSPLTVEVTYRSGSNPWSGYTKPTGSLTIPSTVTYSGSTYSVTSIGDSAFYYCSGLTNVSIPSSVTYIGYGTFWGCSGLTNVTIPNSVTTIGVSAFSGCSGLTNVSIPNSVSSIGGHAFYGCSGLTNVNYTGTIAEWCGISFGNIYANPTYYAHTLSFNNIRMGTTLTIPNSVTSIGNSAFSGCNRLTTVTIPNSVTSIGNSAFSQCTGLTNVTIGNSVTTIGNWAFSGCTSLTNITIGNSVTTIGDYAFSGCSNVDTLYYNAKNLITSSDWYNSSSSYNSYGFRPMALHNLVIGDSVQSLPEGVFYNQSELTNVSIGNSVTSIGQYAFSGCNNVDTLYYNAKNLITTSNWYNYSSNSFGFRFMTLHNLVIGDSVQSLPEGVFYNQNELTNVSIGNSVTSIGQYAFSGCNNVDTLYYNAKNLITTSNWYNYSSYGFYPMALHNLVIGDNVQSLPTGVFFHQSGLTNVTIGNSVTTIGDYAFSGCNGLTNVTIPNSVTTIGQYAFSGCSGLTNVTIPNSVTTIGQYAFSGCSGLTNVTIPNSVTSIGGCAFGSCIGLTSVNFNADSCIINNPYYVFWDCTNLTQLTIGPNVKIIPNHAFYGCSGLTNVTIPNSVTTIGSYAFSNCSGLNSITIPNSVTTIGEQAFYECRRITNVYYSGTIAEWCGISFGSYSSNPTYYAHTLSFVSILPMGTTLAIPNSVTNIGDYAFVQCTGLTTVTIPNSVTSIGNSAFSQCTGLTNVTIGNSVTSIGDYAFSDCNGLTDVTIPNSVTTIKNCAFNNCRNLTNVTIGNSVTTIEHSAFYGCGLTSVTIPNSVSMIGSSAFKECYNLTSVTIGNSVTIIDEYAFDHCDDLTNVTFNADRCMHMGSSSHPVFEGCTNLTKLTIGPNVKTIPNFAFYGCDRIDAITCKAVIPPTVADTNAFEGVWKSLPLMVPSESENQYSYAYGWRDFTNIIGMDFSEEYNITVSVNDTLMGIVTGAGTYTEGDTVTLTAIPNSGYRFVRWSNGMTDNPYTFTATENLDLTAYFEQDSTQGIEEAEYKFEILSNNSAIVLYGAKGQTLRIFDIQGRMIVSEKAVEGKAYAMPSAGIYLIQIGNHLAQKVLVVK